MTMKVQPTYDDANLILRLYELRREPRLREARKWMAGVAPFTSREQWLKVCPPGSEENASYRMVTTYWDMAASFVVNGIVNRELFYRSNNMELVLVWTKVREMVPELRAVAKNPFTMKNIEDVAVPFIEYLNQHAPGFFDGWVANMNRIPAVPSR
jgi:hypothetical protein